MWTNIGINFTVHVWLFCECILWNLFLFKFHLFFILQCSRQLADHLEVALTWSLKWQINENKHNYLDTCSISVAVWYTTWWYTTWLEISKLSSLLILQSLLDDTEYQLKTVDVITNIWSSCPVCCSLFCKSTFILAEVETCLSWYLRWARNSKTCFLYWWK